jgi:hypothetical protein
VSVSGIFEFQNRNRVISIVESEQVNQRLIWEINIISTSRGNFHIYNQTMRAIYKSISKLDIASYESEKVKFQ